MRKLMGLSKAICKRCWDDPRRPTSWSAALDEAWAFGGLWCAALMEDKSVAVDGCRISVDGEPPSGCPYIAEHAVSQ